MVLCTCRPQTPNDRFDWFKNTWVDELECYWEELPEWAEKKVVRKDDVKGRKFYAGWWDVRNDKPAKSEYVRGTDNYSWYFWPHKDEEGVGPVFETRGD